MTLTLYTVKPTTQFKKDLRRIAKQGHNLDLLEDVIKKIANEVQLDKRHRDHDLSGNYKGCRECHVQPDWLLVYEIEKETLYLYLMRTGTHSELF
jgi:mRNA interferase YafQ